MLVQQQYQLAGCKKNKKTTIEKTVSKRDLFKLSNIVITIFFL